jgi:putative ABC transport system ATP-binding protein
VDEVPTATLQLIMLSLAPLLGKPILLVDNPVQNAEVQSFLQGLASVGTEILYTCRENKMQCNQIVNL